MRWGHNRVSFLRTLVVSSIASLVEVAHSLPWPVDAQVTSMQRCALEVTLNTLLGLFRVTTSTSNISPPRADGPLKEASLADIDDEVDELTEVDELVEDEDEQKALVKARWAALEKVIGADPRIEQVAADQVAHFEERDTAQSGKAMVVAMSRDICVHMYNATIALRPDWHDEDPEKGVACALTGGHVAAVERVILSDAEAH